MSVPTRLGITLLLLGLAGWVQAQPPDPARDQLSGFTTVPGGPEAGVLVQPYGRDWRRLRNGPVRVWGGWALAGTLALIGGFYLWRGRVRLADGRSGQRIPRWSLFERTLHWLVALLFVLLALTGLSLLLGRLLLLPLLGHQAFGFYAQWALWLHNFAGPVFGLSLLVMIAVWFKDNVFKRLDWFWFKEGGGIVYRDKHPPAERMNGGEKAWFWLLCSVGLVTVASGLVLDFPVFGQSRATMQLASTVHAVLALIWVAAFFGHAYIGSVGMEGTLEGMIDGRVDTNWAAQHHRVWYRRKLAGKAAEDDRELQAAPAVDN